MGNRYVNKPEYTLLQQKVALKSAYHDSKCDYNKKHLMWNGKIKPTPLSKEYTVVITYELWKSPKVWVIGDELERLDDSDFPHKYDVDSENKMARICLYRYQEFTPYKLLADTIVPWTIEWLYYYELWLATGEWLGGGEHPRLNEAKTDE